MRPHTDSVQRSEKRVGASEMQSRFIFYRPQTKFREGNVFAPVCHSVNRGGWLPSMHYRPHDQDLAGEGESAFRGRGLTTKGPAGLTTGGLAIPLSLPELGKRAVRILLECYLVLYYFILTWSISEKSKLLSVPKDGSNTH